MALVERALASFFAPYAVTSQTPAALAPATFKKAAHNRETTATT
jgi:hypothetical protein